MFELLNDYVFKLSSNCVRSHCTRHLTEFIGLNRLGNIKTFFSKGEEDECYIRHIVLKGWLNAEMYLFI